VKENIRIRIFESIAILFFLAYLVYYIKQVDISLIYYWQQSIAISFGEALTFPGGFSEMLGDKIIESYINPVGGSISILLISVLYVVSLGIIFRKHISNHLFIPVLLGAFIPFALLFSFYRFPSGLIICLVTGLILTAVHSLYQPHTLLLRTVY